MGSNAVIPSSGAFVSRTSYSNDYFNRVHIVKVLEVDIPEGIIRLGPPIGDTITMPLLGMSIPAKTDGSRQYDFKASSWGRYIPQVGDMIMVAFATDGRPYALGHSTLSYGNMDSADIVNEDTGGTGWGTVAEKSLKPGDWDFKASRGSTFYLGDKATIASSICSLTLSQNTQDVTLSAPLSLQKAGNSVIRYGSVRRLEVITDPSESWIHAVPPKLIPGIAQEYTIDLRWNNQLPEGASLAYWSIGDVIDDTTKKARVSSNVLPVRRAFTSVDTTGLIESYSEIVDTNGNYEVESISAISFSWSTLLAAWEVSNLSTSVSSTTTIEMSALAGMTLDSQTTMELSSLAGMTLDSQTTLDASATAVLTLESALIKLGQVAASPAVKGTELVAAFAPVAAAATTALSLVAIPSPTNNAAAITAIATALVALSISISTTALSTKVLVE